MSDVAPIGPTAPGLRLIRLSDGTYERAVLQRTYDAIVLDLSCAEEYIAYLKQQLVELQAQYDDLCDRYADLCH